MSNQQMGRKKKNGINKFAYNNYTIDQNPDGK